MQRNLEDLCLTGKSTIREAMALMNKNCRGIALIVNESNKLISTLTDGDARRAILSGVSIDIAIDSLLVSGTKILPPHPISALIGTPKNKLLSILQDAGIRHLPLVEKDNTLMDLVTIDDFTPENELPLQAVIMAGGQGKRLYPLTEKTPKPLLPVAGQPVMERMINQMKDAGIQRVSVTTHYLRDQIVDYFGSGEKFGVEINYLQEDKPLGTAGSLGMLDDVSSPILVVNGDILTKVDFRSMLSFHKEHKADLTVAVRQYDLQVPYGILSCDGAYVKSIEEKPAYKFLVNAGMYLLEPSVFQFFPKNDSKFDMTDLMELLLEKKKNLVSFPLVEYWLDIGQFSDYEKAQKDLENEK